LITTRRPAQPHPAGAVDLDGKYLTGVDLGDVAAQLQRDGATSFVDAWNELMDRIEAQTSAVA